MHELICKLVEKRCPWNSNEFAIRFKLVRIPSIRVNIVTELKSVLFVHLCNFHFPVVQRLYVSQILLYLSFIDVLMACWQLRLEHQHCSSVPPMTAVSAVLVSTKVSGVVQSWADDSVPNASRCRLIKSSVVVQLDERLGRRTKSRSRSLLRIAAVCRTDCQ